MHVRSKRAVSTLSIVAMALLASGPSQAQDLQSSAGGGGVGVLDFAPPGTLYDNDVANLTTSVASQDSAAFPARTADDFLLDGSTCPTGLFAISLIRVQMVQNDSAPQTFAVDLYADNGAGTAPTPAGSISPFATYPQTSSTNLGVFGVGTSLWEASFDTTGLTVASDTTYWLSGYGANAAANAGGFFNFFAVSNGGLGMPNGVIIAPNSGVPSWTAVESVIAGPPLHFSFAIDGDCVAPVPTMGPLAMVALAATLALLGMLALRRVAATD